MNEIINKILLAADKFILEIHLRVPVFTYSVYAPLANQKGRIPENKETGHSKHLYNKLDKVCFQHDMADFKNLPTKTASD